MKIRGKIHGNNLLEVAYFEGSLGSKSKEPFFKTQDGTCWSNWDVRWIPDNEKEFEAAYKKCLKTHDPLHPGAKATWHNGIEEGKVLKSNKKSVTIHWESGEIVTYPRIVADNWIR